MKGPWLLAFRHALHDRAQTLILTLCLAVPMFLPLAVEVMITSYEADLTARAEGTPLVAGAKGNRFDLVLAALYFRQPGLDTIPYSEVERLQRRGEGVAVPLHARFTARGRPVVGTSPEYFELRGLRAARGTVPLELGDAVLGSEVAAALGLGPGDLLFSDQKELYDISKPPALRMHVCGVLAAAGTPDDGAVFVDVKTSWILEGIAHGHGDVGKLPPSYLLGRTGTNLTVSRAMIPYNEVTADNVATFHYHGDKAALPLTAVLFFPAGAKAATLVKSRTNASGPWQMVVPAAVIRDLMAFVFRIKAVFDAFSAVLGACMLLMTVLVVLLSTRLRKREMETLDRIGCSRFMVAKLHAYELVLVVLASAVLAALGTGVAALLLPDLVRVL